MPSPTAPLSHDPHDLRETQVIGARVEFFERSLASPFVLSTGTIHTLTEAVVSVEVQTPAGPGTGRGSIYLSDLWAWPSAELSHEVRDAALRSLCQDIADHLPQRVGGSPAHPLELGLRLHDAVCHHEPPSDDSAVPILAQAMCLSPFDAAIHDAAGQALHMHAMDFYQDDALPTSADSWFDHAGAMSAIKSMLQSASPRQSLAAWWLVGKADHLENDVRPAFSKHGYHCFKLKLHGRDVCEDVARTIEMGRAATAWGATPRLSVDTNESCRDAQFVLEYLRELEKQSPTAFAQLEYLEQPTARDIAAHPYDWHEVAGIKPVLLDEGLTSFDRLPMALEQGWSGLALKTCKGHSFALVAAAWAHRNKMLLALQDLTNPGYSAVHAALFAAHVPTINGLELNSPQFTPEANSEFISKWPGLFDIQEGQHRVQQVTPTGLGSSV